ncbi:MAG: hypothetical protein M1830_002712, partial [Pleopsidium flavum]
MNPFISSIGLISILVHHVNYGRNNEPLTQEVEDFIAGRGPPPAPAEVHADSLAVLDRIGAAGGFSNDYYASSEGSAEDEASDTATAAAVVNGNSQEESSRQNHRTGDNTSSDTFYDGGSLQHLHARIADTALREPNEIEETEKRGKVKKTKPSVSSDSCSSNVSYSSFVGFASDAGSLDDEVDLVQYLSVHS